ncbi:MAG: 3-oxoacyl-ACP synthase III [Deltaproteobacteria bacterium]|jgi:3-oxoacyl-[acyl-carrier-protein] synthase-3|nr:3-oxoacyl-ACP synthase III [Deltaproteobacteria bacterium]
MTRQPLRFNRTAILAHARDEGPETLTSEALEGALAPTLERLRLPTGLLGRMTGVLSRSLYPPDSPPSRGALSASQKLFRRDPRLPSEIDLLYSTSVGRDFLEPSTASILSGQLGLSPQSSSLDLGSACLGFMDGMRLAALHLESSLIDYALVVAGENSRPILENTLETLLAPDLGRAEFFRNFATLTLGSGGAAALLGDARHNPQAPRLKAQVSLADPQSSDLCRGDYRGMETDSALLLQRGVELARQTFALGREAFGWTPAYFDLYVCHQVSEANTRKLAEILKLPWERIYKTYPLYGNMGPVAIPFALDLAAEKGLIKPHSRLALMGIGSGLNCAIMEVEIP